MGAVGRNGRLWGEEVAQTEATALLEVSNLTRRRWFLTGAVLVLLFALCGGAAWAYTSHTAYKVTIDGVEVGMVRDPVVVQAAIGAEAVLRSFNPGRVQVIESVRAKPVHSVLQARTLDAVALRHRLSSLITFQLQGAQLVVDGKVAVTLPDRATAEAVLRQLRADYLAAIGANHEGVTVKSVETVQRVTIRETAVDPDSVTAAVDKAIAILERGTDREQVHEVARGETLWRIAKDNGLTAEDILAANPGIQPKYLQAGQKVSLVVPTPFITFRDTEVRVQKQAIPFTTKTVKDSGLNAWQRVTRQSGQSGLKAVTTEVSRENGQVVSTKVLATAVLREPVTAVVAIGTKSVVASGTGRVIWPTNGGIVTSLFGIRWGRLHTGIDIGVPAGTPVYAADGGTVVDAGWDGNYGRRVLIYHSSGLATLYAHLSAVRVQSGEQVKQGQIIGLSGRSGDATGPHLHFEIRVDGSPVNPMKYFH